MTLHIVSILSLSLVVCFSLATNVVIANDDSSDNDVLSDWKLMQRKADYIRFEKKDSAVFIYTIDRNISEKNKSSRQYTSELMKRFNGADLRPVPEVHGWEFSFVTDKPCAAVISKATGLMNIVFLCGSAKDEEVSSLIKISKHELE